MPSDLRRLPIEAIPHDPIDPVSMDEVRAQFEASIEGLTNDTTPLYVVEGAA